MRQNAQAHAQATSAQPALFRVTSRRQNRTLAAMLRSALTVASWLPAPALYLLNEAWCGRCRREVRLSRSFCSSFGFSATSTLPLFRNVGFAPIGCAAVRSQLTHPGCERYRCVISPREQHDEPTEPSASQASRAVLVLRRLSPQCEGGGLLCRASLHL
jgi:hypothetical protein